METDLSSDLATETQKQFRVIIAAARRHYHALEAACGISGAQVWMLAAIADTPGISVSRLSRTLSVHVSTASSLLDKLAKSGMVERRRGAVDRRVVNLHLTETGRATLDRAPHPLTGPVPHALDQLPEAILARLHEDLALFIRQMNDVDLEAAHKPRTDPYSLSTLVI